MSREQELKKQLDETLEELREKFPPDKLMELEVWIDPKGMYVKSVPNSNMVDYVARISTLNEKEIYSYLESVRDMVGGSVTQFKREIESHPRKITVEDVLESLKQISRILGGEKGMKEKIEDEIQELEMRIFILECKDRLSVHDWDCIDELKEKLRKKREKLDGCKE